jgi:myo-inositol-1(or 4)-monophosphatase
MHFDFAGRRSPSSEPPRLLPIRAMHDLAELRFSCELAARAGGAALLAWRGRFVASEKKARDLVTDADLASQAAVARVLAERHPDHALLGEESPDAVPPDRGYCWIVDPLDGTTNYVHGFPCYAVSVAVACDGRLLAGVVFDPLAEECFSAAVGCGATLNGQRLRVSDVQRIDHALVAVSLPPQLRRDSPDLLSFLQTAPLCQAIRRTGSAALNLAYVASGRLDAHWAHEIHAWDAAAGVLLVQESGGVCTNVAGAPFQLAAPHYLAAANRHLHAQLLPLITPARHAD